MDVSTAINNIANNDREVRHQAFEAINLAGERAMPALIGVLYENDDVRQEIAIAILWEMFREHGYKHRDLIPALVSAIKANIDNNPLVVMDGMGLLTDLKDSSAFEPLVEFLCSAEEEVRVGAVEALANLKDPRAVPHIAHLLNDEVQDVRDRSLWALNYIGILEALSAIEKWKTKNEDHDS